MITQTSFSVPLTVIDEAKSYLPNNDFKLSINEPTGRFFYDPWKIKEEFKNTVWDRILSTLPEPIGEARIIHLKHGTTYMSHCDIDNRYHLNIEGQYSFLIDIDSHRMFPTVTDGIWYVLDTGVRHVAANFGSYCRTQLVVRHLLNDSKLDNAASVSIVPVCENPRFEFDDIISPWLHKMNKEYCLSEFKAHEDRVSFKLDQRQLTDLDLFPADKFKIIVEK